MEKYQIPSLNFRNYLFATQSTKKSPQKIPSDLSRKKQSSPKFNRSLFNGIFTVAESLNENYIIKTLQPDLGSLESFVNLKEKPNFENYRQSLKNMRKTKKNDQHSENPEDMFLNKKGIGNKIIDPIETLKLEFDDNKTAAASKLLINQMIHDIYGDDLENIEDMENKNDEGFRFSTVNFQDHVLKIIKKYPKLPLNKKFEVLKKYLEKIEIKQKAITLTEDPKKQIQISSSFDKTKISQNDSNYDKIERKFSEKKYPSITSFSIAKKEYSLGKIAKSPKSTYKTGKDTAINICTSKYIDFEDLWTKFKTNHDDLKKAKQNFLGNLMKNQNIHQNTFDKLEGVHFGIDEKKLDNKLFLNDSKKFITWNIQYNPYIFIGLIKDEITFDNLQRIDLVNANLEESLLLVLMEIINIDCPFLYHLDLSYNKADFAFINLLKICIQTHDLKDLILAGMGITSKMICVLALGIAHNHTLEELNLQNNLITNAGLKSIETLLRYVKNLQKLDLTNNQITSFKDLRKIIMFNKNIKEKIIKL